MQTMPAMPNSCSPGVDIKARLASEAGKGRFPNLSGLACASGFYVWLLAVVCATAAQGQALSSFSIDSSHTNTQDTTITWDLSTGASGYSVSVATDANFTNVVKTLQVSQGQAHTLTADLGLLPYDTMYYAKVQASSGTVQLGAANNGFRFYGSVSPNPTSQTIFVTPFDVFITQDPSVPPNFPEFGGVAAADWMVNYAASNAGLLPNWDGITPYYHALLSTTEVSAKKHVNVVGPVYNVHGDLIASNSTAFWGGSLTNPVLYDANENAVTSANAVATGSTSLGNFSGTNGGNWLNTAVNATVGNPTVTNTQWTSNGTGSASGAFRLYGISPPYSTLPVGTHQEVPVVSVGHSSTPLTATASQTANCQWLSSSPRIIPDITFGSTASSYSLSLSRYTTTDGGLITDIFNFPTNFQGSYRVVAGGLDLGTYSAGDHLHFSGSGVSSFTISGIGPATSANVSPNPFALQLGYNESAANLSIAMPATWSLSASTGNWSSTANWIGTNFWDAGGGTASVPVPNADGALAQLGGPLTTSTTATLDTAKTVGMLALGSSSAGLGYTLSGSGANSLTFSNTSGGSLAQISVIDGTHAINATVVLASDMVITSGGTSAWSLTFGTSSRISGSRALTMSGVGGTLVLSGSNSFSGALNVDAGTLNMTGGSASPGGAVVGLSSTGNMTQSGGNFTPPSLVLGQNAGSSGSYNFGSGSLATSGNVILGNSGSGSFSQTGGVATITGSGALYLGYAMGASGSYSLGGGSLTSSGNMIVGNSGNGNFSQTGGVETITGTGALYLGNALGASGSYSLGGGTLMTSGKIIVGNNGNGSFLQTGGVETISGTGTMILGNLSGGGTYNLVGGSLTVPTENIGNSGSGAFTQSGGKNTVNALYVGFVGNGSYLLSGTGLLSAPSEFLSNGASGTFTQTGGTNSAGSIYLGVMGPTATYSLSGSGLVSTSSEYIGYSGGTGVFTQTGGTNSVSGPLVLGFASASSGTCNFNGGLLLSGTGGISKGTGAALFNFGGGTLGASAPWSSTLAMTLTGSGGNSNVDTSGGSIGLSGVLSGTGGLVKRGSGLLMLSGSDTYSGGTSVLGGTLSLQGARSLFAGSSLVIGSGASHGDVFIPPVSIPAESSQSVNVVPEPGTLWLMIAAGVAAAIYRTRGAIMPPQESGLNGRNYNV